jgi:hypothetical protein
VAFREVLAGKKYSLIGSFNRNVAQLAGVLAWGASRIKKRVSVTGALFSFQK